MTMTKMSPENEMPGATLVASGDSGFRNALEPSDFASAYNLAAIAAKVHLCGVTSPEDALVRIMTGREMGLTAFQAMRLVYVVEGRPALDASFMLALCINRPECEYFECVETTREKATYRAKRRGRKEQVLTWTIEQAVAAGLLSRGKDPSKNNWNRYPDAMLRARCVSALARMVFPEAICGLYTREELAGIDSVATYADEMTAEIVEPSPSPVPPQAAQRDFAAESDAIKQRIVDAKTKDELKAVRAEAAAFVADAGEPWATQLRNFYSVTMSKPPKAAPPPPPPSASEVERPADAGDAWEGAA